MQSSMLFESRVHVIVLLERKLASNKLFDRCKLQNVKKLSRQHKNQYGYGMQPVLKHGPRSLSYWRVKKIRFSMEIFT